MSPERPLLIVIGSGGREYREYLLRSISTRYRVHLLTGEEPTWQREYIHGWTVLATMEETVSADEMTVATKQVAAQAHVDGILTWDEARVLQVAKVAAAMGLPGGDPAVAMRCRDKHLTREAMATAELAQPQSLLVRGADEALAAAEQIGYPVVLKPRAMAGGLGVVRADGPEELTAHFAFARGASLPGAWIDELERLVEEYLDGPEISIDSAIYQGQVFPLCLARKEVGYPPYFEEVGHVVDAGDPLLTDPEILRSLDAVHRAVGFTDGMTHAEFKLTPRGPKVIEINGRLGGDMIPYLGLRTSGIDPGLAAADVACGRRPQLVADRRRVAAVRFFYVEHEVTTIGSIEFADNARTAATDRLVTLVEPGAVVSPPPKGILFGRIAFATAVADSEQECRQALDAAQAALQVRPADELAGAGA